MTTRAAAFDSAAPGYDHDFTERRIGRMLRAQVQRVLAEAFVSGDQMLDLGCGTGEDAVWLAQRGIHVTAVDGSPAMLSVARAKARREGNAGAIAYRELDLAAARLPLEDCAPAAGFDGALSNFGAVNCIADRPALAGELGRLIRPGGRLLLVVMGPFCALETVGHLCRGRIRPAFRRWRRRPLAYVGGEAFPVWYPSARRIRREFDPWFRRLEVFGVGVFLPPTEFRDLVDRWPRLFSRLSDLDQRVGRNRPATWVCDHHATLFERR